MDAVFASSVVSEDSMQRVLERFQAAECALREGGQAAAPEASETATAEGWNRVGSATSTHALNPFVAVLLGYEPPLGSVRGLSIFRDVPDTPVKVEPKAAADPPGAPPAAATLGPSDVQAEKEARRASRNPAGAPRPVRGRTPPPPPESTRNRRAGRTPEPAAPASGMADRPCRRLCRS